MSTPAEVETDPIRIYAAEMVRKYGQHNPEWDLIAECWEGEEDLTGEELDRAFSLILRAEVVITLPSVEDEL
ncbi:hypothetical protein [Kribbella italica]|uniref:Uncharacterized protein n=1 Tax=Kribbella italica TaxID=1540520 RepID=A0A7W9MRE5_9ACTN|nr:hypothetical protein [Kribbella italica]MBB5833459.1 hypothetical protein [Kribbella italica]